MATTHLPGREKGAAVRIDLMTAQTITTAAANALIAAVTGLGSYRQAVIALIQTDAQAAAGDTLDVFVDASPDGGTTWVNAVHFAQSAGNGTDAITQIAVLDPGGAPGTSTVATTSDAAAGAQRPTVLFDQLRVRYTLVDGGAHGQSYTFGVVALLK